MENSIKYSLTEMFEILNEHNGEGTGEVKRRLYADKKHYSSVIINKDATFRANTAHLAHSKEFRNALMGSLGLKINK